jgi:ribosomal protein S18 acetylase RimI-like enzyme
MGQKFAIEPLTLERIDDSVGVILRAFDASYEKDARLELGRSLSPHDHFDRPETFVALQDGKVVGTIQTAQNYAHFDVYSLSWIAVDPAMQGRGVGKSMVRHAEEHIARNILNGKPGTILIVDDTRVKNPGTDYYLRMGYADGPVTHRGMQVMVKIVNK